MKAYIAVAAIAGLAVGFSVAAFGAVSPSLPPQGAELYRCQVHRGGGRDTRPDNALETFLWCWGHGVAPEADARLTKDGVAIAFHDATLKRVGRGISKRLAAAKIKDLDWAQIRDVDTGSYLDSAYSSVRIPTIDSVLAAMAGRPERLLYLDEKGAPPELVAEIARKYGVEKQIYFTSPDFKLMARWQKVVPGGLGMVWLGTWPKDNSPKAVAKADRFLEESLDRMEAAGWRGISQVQIHIRTDLSKTDPFCPSSDCIRRAIARLHKNGITVQAFTWTEGDNKDVLRKIWKLGFDNFATDDPLVLFELLPGLAKHKTGNEEKIR
jgi:glycerophosphoryl diester phosphodiesterase